jgi:hypothetical protein
MTDERIEIRPIRPEDRELLAEGVRGIEAALRETLRAAGRGLLHMRLPHR